MRADSVETRHGAWSSAATKTARSVVPAAVGYQWGLAREMPKEAQRDPRTFTTWPGNQTSGYWQSSPARKTLSTTQTTTTVKRNEPTPPPAPLLLLVNSFEIMLRLHLFKKLFISFPVCLQCTACKCEDAHMVPFLGIHIYITIPLVLEFSIILNLF